MVGREAVTDNSDEWDGYQVCGWDIVGRSGTGIFGFLFFDFQGITLPYFLGTGREVSGRTWTGVSMMINHFFNVACGFVCVSNTDG